MITSLICKSCSSRYDMTGSWQKSPLCVCSVCIFFNPTPRSLRLTTNKHKISHGTDSK